MSDAPKPARTQSELNAMDEMNSRAIVKVCAALGITPGTAQEFADRTVVNSRMSRRPSKS